MSRNAFAQCEREYNEAEEMREHSKQERIAAMKATPISKGLYRVNGAIVVPASNGADAICRVIRAMIEQKKRGVE